MAADPPPTANAASIPIGGLVPRAIPATAPSPTTARPRGWSGRREGQHHHREHSQGEQHHVGRAPGSRGIAGRGEQADVAAPRARDRPGRAVSTRWRDGARWLRLRLRSPPVWAWTNRPPGVEPNAPLDPPSGQTAAGRGGAARRRGTPAPPLRRPRPGGYSTDDLEVERAGSVAGGVPLGVADLPSGPVDPTGDPARPGHRRPCPGDGHRAGRQPRPVGEWLDLRSGRRSGSPRPVR